MLVPRNKEDARKDWYEMIQKSWTWNKLTKEEQDRFMEALMAEESLTLSPIKGDYMHRWEILEGFYHMFLIGLGYKPLNWRE